MDQRVAGCGVGQSHHRGLRIDVDEDMLGCVGGRAGRLGHHRRHRLADEADGVAGQHRPGHPLVDHWDRLQIGQVQVGRGEHPEHAGLLPGIGCVHAGEAPLGHGGAHEAGADRTVETQVGHVAGSFGEHPGILGAQHPVAQHAHGTVTCLTARS